MNINNRQKAMRWWCKDDGSTLMFYFNMNWIKFSFKNSFVFPGWIFNQSRVFAYHQIAFFCVVVYAWIFVRHVRNDLFRSAYVMRRKKNNNARVRVANVRVSIITWEWGSQRCKAQEKERKNEKKKENDDTGEKNSSSSWSRERVWSAWRFFSLSLFVFRFSGMWVACCRRFLRDEGCCFFAFQMLKQPLFFSSQQQQQQKHNKSTSLAYRQ